MNFRLRAFLLALPAFAPLACGDDDDGVAASPTPDASVPVVTADAGSDAAPPRSAGTFRVLSGRADLVTGGDALVELVPADGVDATTLTLAVGTTDVTSAFAVRAGGRFAGLVTGLATADNVLTARAADGATASVTLVNHPISGPLLYGPQIQPWACDTGATDAACSRPIAYRYVYVSTNPATHGFPTYDPAAPPTDIATTTTDAGKTVPFVVRIETGVQDRDYYDVAVLFDPAQPWSRWQPQTGWNQKLLVEHGSGCGNGYAQSNVLSAARVLDTYALGRGYAVLAVSLNDAGHDCNLAVEAEAMTMAKEHVVEAYGDLRYTFGYGASGGGLAQQWIANAYPGIYDGIIGAVPFPDAISTMLEVEDCALLTRYFGQTQTAWSAAAQAAASGHLNTAVCNEWINVYGFNNDLNPAATNLLPIPGSSTTALGGCDAPASVKFDPVTNPTGVRCDLQDSAISVFGARTDGRANRPYSNVGVQYGLAALSAGTITVDQFVDLNASIGSHTIDYAFQAARTAADPASLAAAYRSGFVNEGGGMTSVAILHLRPLDVSGIHHQYRSWAMRARLDRANGGHGNQAIWYAAGTQNESYDVMDAWLAAVTADASTATRAQKIIADRPAQANDRCGAVDGTGLSMVQCTGVSDGSTRMGAGADIADDVLECPLVPLDRASYAPVVFTDAQWARMQATFATGVCDRTKPGTGQQPALAWPSYLKPDGSVVVGGAALPAAP